MTTLEEKVIDSLNLVHKYEDEFYKRRMTINPALSKQDGLSLFKVNLDENVKRFCHEFDINYTNFGGKRILGVKLHPVYLKYMYDVTENLIANSKKLKPASTFIGKNAEMAIRNTLKSFLHLFRVNKQIELNNRAFVCGGDGGGDFFFDVYTFDSKYRNDSPAHGMILEQDFVEKLNDDVILIHVTNSFNIKVGDLTLEQIATQNLPLALSGWVTAKDFKARAKTISNGRNSLALDDVNPIMSLFLKIIEEQIGTSGVESLFYYP